MVVASGRDVEPVRAAAPGAAGQIVAGVGHTCVIAVDNRVMCWGDNQFGQLGDSAFPDGRSTVPVATSGFGGRTPVQLAAGRNHTCARMSDGTVWCWGYNGYLELGVGGGTFADPTQVTLPAAATSISAAGNTSCARTATQLLCWGRNNKGQLGIGSTKASGGVAPTALPVVPGTFDAVSVAGGFEHTCAASAAGEVWCWGEAGRLQLGNAVNSTVDQSSPVRTDALGDSALSVSAGDEFSCARITGGTAWCWGDNQYGQLGRGSTSPASSAAPTAVAGTGTVSVLSAGGFHACAVTGVGALRCWGRNDKGQLGVGSTSDAYTPAAVTVAGGTVSDVAAGALHTCAVLNTGTVQCWGDNQFGQLGTGDIAQRTAPVSVASLPAVYSTTTASSSSTSSSSTSTTTSSPTTSTTTTAPASPVQPALDATSTTSTTTALPTTTTVAVQRSPAVARTGGPAGVLTVRRGRTVTAARIAGATGLSIPRGSQGRLRLSIVSGAGRCRFAGTSVRGTAVGTCRVRAVLIRTKGPTLVRTVTVKVVR